MVRLVLSNALWTVYRVSFGPHTALPSHQWYAQGQHSRGMVGQSKGPVVAKDAASRLAAMAKAVEQIAVA